MGKLFVTIQAFLEGKTIWGKTIKASKQLGSSISWGSTKLSELFSNFDCISGLNRQVA
jgi:hypothetical protein